REKGEALQVAMEGLHAHPTRPGLDGYSEDEVDERQLLTEAFDVRSYFSTNPDDPLTTHRTIQDHILALAEQGAKTEKKLALHLGGYQQRQKLLRQKIAAASEALEQATRELDVKRTAQVAEQAAIGRRLERLREEVAFVSRREREAQD